MSIQAKEIFICSYTYLHYKYIDVCLSGGLFSQGARRCRL